MPDIHGFVVQQEKMLANLEHWLDKAAEHAAKKKFDVAVLLQSRLAPDMLPLVRQIQSACDHSKFLAARLAGKDPPKHPDTEHTLDELRARIQSVRRYLKSFSPSDFADGETRVVPLPVRPGKGMTGTDYLIEFNLPNALFHLTTAYAILRHNGVELGKMDFLGTPTVRDL